MLARPGLPDSVGHRLAAALYKIERERLESKQLSETTARNTLAALPWPGTLQPGVAAYYMEAGLLT